MSDPFETVLARARELEAALTERLAKERDEAQAENDVNHGWVYCPMCGSCGVGGCCGYFCAFCKDRHDGETQAGDAPRDLGDLSLVQGGWQLKVNAANARTAAAESSERSLRSELAAHVEDWKRAAAIREEEFGKYPDAPSRSESVAFGRGLARAAEIVSGLLSAPSSSPATAGAPTCEHRWEGYKPCPFCPAPSPATGSDATHVVACPDCVDGLTSGGASPAQCETCRGLGSLPKEE